MHKGSTGSREFNGHKNWAHFNVYTWLTNDDGFYRKMIFYKKVTTSLDKAAERMLHYLEDIGELKTPDGAKYSKTAIKEAMRDLT